MIALIIFGIFAIGGYFFVTKTQTGQSAASTVSDYAASLVSQFEGFSATAYKDVAGYLTIGYGHKIQPGETVPAQMTQTEAQTLLNLDLQTARDAVDQYVTVPLNENQRTALVSFVFNVGMDAFRSSTLLSKLNSGDYQGAADEFTRWNQAGGKVINGLVARRESEQQIFLS